MPDNSIECVLGRLQESVDTIKDELKNLKEDHTEIKQFVQDQKTMYRYFWFTISLVGSFIYLAKDIFEFIDKHILGK